MESNYLKSFIAVVKTGSFTKAAENLFVTQSAITRRIQYMEKQYECLLLDRDGPVLKPTAKGQVFFDKANKILEIEQELQLEINQKKEKPSLSFISTPTFGVAYLPQIFSDFMKAQGTAISVKFTFEMPPVIREKLRHGVFEVAVIEHCADFDLSELETIALPADELVFAVAAGKELSQREFQLKDLLEYPLLSCSTGCCTTIILKNNLKSKGLSYDHFQHVIEITDLNMLLKSLFSGAGIAFISLALIRPFLMDYPLEIIRVPGFIHQRNRTLVFSDKTMNCGLNKQFTEQIINHLNCPPA